MTKKQELKSTAYHEAGHVIAAHNLGIPCKKVTIKPDADTLGYSIHNKLRIGVKTGTTASRGRRRVTDAFLKKQDYVQRRIMVSMAGYGAEKRYNGWKRDSWPRRSKAKGDWEIVEQGLEFLEPGNLEAQNALNKLLTQKTEQLVRYPVH